MNTVIRSEARLRKDVLERPCFLALAERQYPQWVTVVDGVSITNLPEDQLDDLAKQAEEAARRAVADIARITGKERQAAVALFWDGVVAEGMRSDHAEGFTIIGRNGMRPGMVKAKDPGFEQLADLILRRAAYHPLVQIDAAQDWVGELRKPQVDSWALTVRGEMAMLFAAEGKLYLAQERHWADGWFRDEAQHFENLLEEVREEAYTAIFSGGRWTDPRLVEDEEAEVAAVTEAAS